MLVRLLYASRAAAPLTAPVVESILAQSRAHNPRLGITGILCYSEDLFLQVLEGGRDEVCELYNTIVRDDRHTNVRILTYEEISERRFGNWTMGHVDIATVNPSLLLKYAKLPVLNPFNCSGHASMALLEELLATASVIGRSELVRALAAHRDALVRVGLVSPSGRITRLDETHFEEEPAEPPADLAHAPNGADMHHVSQSAHLWATDTRDRLHARQALRRAWARLTGGQP